MILKELSEAFGVSGDEEAVRKLILDAIKDHVTDIQIDAVGNLTAIKKGTGQQAMRVMLDAHMDEVGFMVIGHDSNGLIKFTNIGGVDARILPGKRVQIGAAGINGVVVWKPIHFGNSQSVKQISDLRIDIGVTSKSAAEDKAKLGTRIAFHSEFMEIGKTTWRGKALDNRLGCAMLIELLQGGPYPVDILAAFTVQEEIGLRGAQVAAQRLQSDLAIVLESTPAHDVPDPEADPDDPTTPNPACKLGDGPVLTVMDASMITPPHLLRFMRETATEAGIPYQFKTVRGGGNDAGQIHLLNGGIPSVAVSIACRYIHSPSAYMNRNDYQQGIQLVQAALHKLTPEIIVPA